MTRLAASVERAAEIDASADDVWSVVSDVARLGDLMPEVERYEQVDDGWRWVMAPQRRLGQTFQPRFTVRYELDPGRAVRFEHVAGPGDSAEAGGRIALRGDDEEPTRVDFRLDLTVEVPVPGLLAGPVRAMLSEEIRRLADGFLANVRTAVE